METHGVFRVCRLFRYALKWPRTFADLILQTATITCETPNDRERAFINASLIERIHICILDAFLAWHIDLPLLFVNFVIFRFVIFQRVYTRRIFFKIKPTTCVADYAKYAFVTECLQKQANCRRNNGHLKYLLFNHILFFRNS